MIAKINTLIVDDDPHARTITSRVVQMNPILSVVGICASATEAYAVLAEKEVDLLICDIEMPDISGIQFVRSMQRPPLVVFLTNHVGYALACYEVSPVDFLTKPLDPARFLSTVDKVRQRLLQPSEADQLEPYFFLKDGQYSFTQIRCSDVRYMQADDSFVRVVTANATYMPVLSLAKVEDQLKSDLFVRVHRSFLVNRSFIRAIHKNDLELIDSTVIPIGDQYRSQLHRKHVEGHVVSR